MSLCFTAHKGPLRTQGGNSIDFLLARVSNQKGYMYKLLKWLYCGLKILAEILPQFWRKIF